MSDVVRTEEWQFDHQGMISLLVLDVHEGETVWVTQEFTEELRLDPARSKEIVPPGREQFVNEFPYSDIRDAIVERGGVSYAGTP